MEPKMYAQLVGYLPVKGDVVFLVCPSALVPHPARTARAREPDHCHVTYLQQQGDRLADRAARHHTAMDIVRSR